MKQVLAAVAVVAAMGLVAVVLGLREAAPTSPSTRSLQVALGRADRPLGVATGFTAGPGQVVTVAHLLEGRAGAGLQVREGAGAWRPARVLTRDRRTDLALLAVPGLRAKEVRIGRAGDRVWLLAHRGGPVAVGVRRTMRAALRGPGRSRVVRRRALELAASVSAGASGAPVLTPGGEVAGVVFARSLRRDDTAYAVSAGAVRRLLDSSAGTAAR